uniref:Solute carrier family 22 member 6 n=1 Tax=Anabas testudineus TaxID=64144 RepID=A0A3Q1IR34_ANATE
MSLSKMKFDNILSEINGFGKFQIKLVLIQMLSRLSMPCHFLLNNFMAAVPSHHCDISSLDDGGIFRNLTMDQKLAVSIPAERDGSLSSCQMFLQPHYEHLSGSNSTDNTVIAECQTGWVYDNSTFKSTVVTEWDLVCSRKGMSRATATVFFIGVMFGAPLFGFLSDRFGRRPLLLVSYLSSMVFGVISAFSTSYIMFAIMRFFTGMSLAGLSIISIVLNVEWFGIEHRTFSGIIIGLDWTLGNWLLVLIAYLVNEWRMLILAATSPLILSIIAWRWLPESARWLLANGKADAAHHYIMVCAKMNNRAKYMDNITPRALLESAEAETEQKKYTFVDLFRTTNIRKLSICLGIVWYGVAFTYYGICLNITGFGLNPYLTQCIFASIELPMKIGVYFFLEKIGRRPGEVWTLLLTGVCLFTNIFVPLEKWLIRTIVGVLGKAMSEASFTIMYLYTTELFPTVVRQNGLGYTSFLARLGVSISPLVMLLEDAWHLLPAVTYCVVAVGSGLVASLLPETLNARLPEFISDIEKPRAGGVIIVIAQFPAKVSFVFVVH